MLLAAASPEHDPGSPAALPPGWTAHKAPDGTVYYYHAESGTSSWTLPVADQVAGSASPPSTAAVAAGAAASVPATWSATAPVHAAAKSVGVPLVKRARSLSSLNEAFVQASPMRQRAQLESFREELSEKLSLRDGILEPDVEHTLRQWIQVSDELGMRDAAVEASQLLSQNYAGSADISAILESWLDAVKSGLGKTTTAQHLREKIWQRFELSVEPLDDLLMKYERPPVWLAELLDNKQWRGLLIDLASKHRSSSFLNFCVRAIAQAGFHGEVAATLSASTHFAVFKETVAEALCKVVQAVAENALPDVCVSAENDFLKIADSTLPAHAYAMELVSELEKPSRGLSALIRAVLARLRQRSQAPKPMVDPLVRRSAGSLVMINPEVVSPLSRLKSLDQDVANEAVTVLVKLYSAERSPPTWPLREKPVLERLVGLLFQPYKIIPDLAQRNASWLLTLAASDERPDASSALLEALMSASTMCGQEESLSLARVETFLAQDLSPLVLEHPTVAMGFLFWVRAVLSHPLFENSLGYFSATQAMARLVGKIAHAHRMQCHHAFAILQFIVETPKAETVSDAQQVDLWKSAFDGMIDLVREGFVLPVVSFVFGIQNLLDLSLLRHFCKSAMLLAINAPTASWSTDPSFHRILDEMLATEKGKLAAEGGGPEFKRLHYDFRLLVREKAPSASTGSG